MKLIFFEFIVKHYAHVMSSPDTWPQSADSQIMSYLLLIALVWSIHLLCVMSLRNSVASV